MERVGGPACVQPCEGQKLPLYEMGFLDPHEEARFEAHLAACRDCREEFARGRRHRQSILHLVFGDHPPDDRSPLASRR